MNNYICIKQIKSSIRQSKKNKLLLKSLGLKNLNHQVLRKNNKCTKSVILKIQHLISISKINL